MLPRDVMTNTYVMKQNWQVEKDDIIIVSGLKFTELVRPTISRQFEIPPFPSALSSRVYIASTIWMSKNCTKMGKVTATRNMSHQKNWSQLQVREHY